MTEYSSYMHSIHTVNSIRNNKTALSKFKFGCDLKCEKKAQSNDMAWSLLSAACVMSAKHGGQAEYKVDFLQV